MLKRILSTVWVLVCAGGVYLYIQYAREREVSKLVADLHSTNESVTLSAITKLRGMGVRAVPYLEEVITEDKDAVARRNAVNVLAASQTFSERSARPLTVALSDPDSDVRHATGYALQAFGQSGKSALPALILAFKREKSSAVRCRLAEALGSVGRNDGETALVLGKALRTDNDVNVRFCAIHALNMPDGDVIVASVAVTALAQFITTLRGANERGAAIDVIRDWREKGRPATPALAYVLHNDKNKALRYGAINALESVGGDDAVRALISALNDGDRDVREFIKRVLNHKLTGLRDRAVPLLKSALKTEKDEKVRQSYQESLKFIDPNLDISR